jgi:hypothetical protein
VLYQLCESLVILASRCRGNRRGGNRSSYKQRRYPNGSIPKSPSTKSYINSCRDQRVQRLEYNEAGDNVDRRDTSRGSKPDSPVVLQLYRPPTFRCVTTSISLPPMWLVHDLRSVPIANEAFPLPPIPNHDIPTLRLYFRWNMRDCGRRAPSAICYRPCDRSHYNR